MIKLFTLHPILTSNHYRQEGLIAGSQVRVHTLKTNYAIVQGRRFDTLGGKNALYGGSTGLVMVRTVHLAMQSDSWQADVESRDDYARMLLKTSDGAFWSADEVNEAKKEGGGFPRCGYEIYKWGAEYAKKAEPVKPGDTVKMGEAQFIDGPLGLIPLNAAARDIVRDMGGKVPAGAAKIIKNERIACTALVPLRSPEQQIRDTLSYLDVPMTPVKTEVMIEDVSDEPTPTHALCTVRQPSPCGKVSPWQGHRSIYFPHYFTVRAVDYVEKEVCGKTEVTDIVWHPHEPTDILADETPHAYYRRKLQEWADYQSAIFLKKKAVG